MPSQNRQIPSILIRQDFLRYFTNRLKIEGEHIIEDMAKFSLGRITHPLRMFFLSLIVTAFTVESVVAQSDGWAAGEIVLEYVSGDCDPAQHKPGNPSGKPLYNVILKFYRDDYGITAPPFNGTYDVMVYSPDNGISFANAVAHPVSLVAGSRRSVVQYCLNGNPVATEGAFYKSTSPIELWPTGEWYFYFVGQYDGQYRSPEDRNIDLGQKFYIETRFDLDCGFISGQIYDENLNQYIPATKFNPAPRLAPTDYVFEDPVASFCVGQEYEYNLKAITASTLPNLTPAEPITKLEIEFAPIWKGKNELISYITSEGFSIANPFPTERGIDRSDLRSRGIIRFTPLEEFAGPVPFNIKNFIERWWIDPDDINQQLVKADRLSIITQREYRFIFDDNCNSRLPRFIGGVWEDTTGLGNIGFVHTYNGAQDAYEFNCATREFVFRLTEPVLIESLGLIGVPPIEQDQGFRFGSLGIDTNTSGPGPFLDDIPVESVVALDTVNIDETRTIRVTLSEGAGPGKYYLYMKKGDDLNTLVNRCESTIPEYDTLSIIYVNGNFVYEHHVDEYKYCFPTGRPPIAIIDRETTRPWLTGWHYFGGTRFQPPGSGAANLPVNRADDTTFYDTTYLGPRSFIVDHPDDDSWVNSKIFIGAGWWRVGYGIDYSTYDPTNGNLIERRICYDEDEFYVDTVSVEAFSIPDYDLCPKEDLPVIDLSGYKSDIISRSFDWGKWDGSSYKKFFSINTDPSFPPPRNRPDSTGKAYEVVSTTPYIFDTQGPFSGVGDTNFFRAKFNMRGKYQPNKICPVQIEFKVLKQLVDVALNEPNDSVICEGEQYRLWNIESSNYYIPEQYSFQWYLDNVALPNDTTDTLTITESGMYKLVVTKTTDGSVCDNADSVYVRISPYLGAVSPSCTKITFDNGQIEQTFSWNPIPNAADYEVRTVLSPEYASGTDEVIYGPWVRSNGLYGINHNNAGARVGLEVRAVNGGVDENADCRFGDTTYAEPCDAIVKPTNVFTPNGDGINDYLKFDLVEIYPNSSLMIFNRWGKKIYESSDYFNDWDGENFKEGTYFYVLDVNDPRQGILKGTFTIIRD